MGGALGPDRGLSEDEMRDKIAELREGVSELASASNLTSWATKEILVKVRWWLQTAHTIMCFPFRE